MKHTTDHFTNKDGQRIHTEKWQPDSDPTAAIIMVHGYGEHIGRYQHIAERLVNEGYIVYGLDHRGHGQSSGMRVHMETLDNAAVDLHQYVEQIQQEYPDLSIAMYGHSMGSMISLLFTLHHQQELDALAISGTATNGDELLPKPVVSLLRILSNIVPTLRTIKPGDDTILSTDPAAVEAVRNDPLVDHGGWRIGMSYRMIEAGWYIREHAHEITLPILIMHGEEDTLTPITGSYEMYEKVSSTDKTLITYPGMRHEVMNEIEREKVLNDLAHWLKNRLG